MSCRLVASSSSPSGTVQFAEAEEAEALVLIITSKKMEAAAAAGEAGVGSTEVK